jgi:hypothetical protein
MKTERILQMDKQLKGKNPQPASSQPQSFPLPFKVFPLRSSSAHYQV